MRALREKIIRRAWEEFFDEHSFYEIECSKDNWSLKKLQRQFDSALYERLALSRNKKGIKQLAQQGQIVEKPADMLKDT